MAKTKLVRLAVKAAELGVTPDTLLKWGKQGRIKLVRINTYWYCDEGAKVKIDTVAGPVRYGEASAA